MPSRALAALVAVLAAAAARAEDPARRGFDPDVFRPALSLDGNLAVETAGRAEGGTRGVGLLLDYAEGLLALRLDGDREPLIRSRITTHLFLQYAFSRGEVGIDLPVVLRQRSDLSLLTDRGVTGPLVDRVPSTALGDLRLVGKLPLVPQGRSPVALAARK